MKNEKKRNMCDDCLLQNHGYCFCTGEPEKITGDMIACDFYQTSEIKDPQYKNGFIDGYIYVRNFQKGY